MEITTNQLEISAKRTIEEIDLNIGEYKLFKDTIVFSNGEVQIEQGVTTNTSVTGLKEIKKVADVCIASDDILQGYYNGNAWMRTSVISEDIFDKYIENPDKYKIVRKRGSYLVYLNGKYVPKIVSFGRFSGLITNNLYDIDKLQIYLESNPERFENIRNIRVDNYSYIRELRFNWLPDEDEYNIFIKSIESVSMEDVKQYIGIEKFRINKNHNCS